MGSHTVWCYPHAADDIMILLTIPGAPPLPDDVDTIAVLIALGEDCMRDALPDPVQADPGPGAAYAYDIFISYSWQDQTWVRGPLLERLEAHGWRVCMDDRDFQPGAPIVKERERAILTSHYTLVVLTPAFVAGHWNPFHEGLTCTLAQGFTQRRLIPLIKRVCTLPARLAALVARDFTDPTTHDAAYARLVAALDPAPRLRPVELALPTPVAAPGSIIAGARTPQQPDQRFLTVTALADRGIALAQQLMRVRFGVRHITLAEAHAWRAEYAAWTTACARPSMPIFSPTSRRSTLGRSMSQGSRRSIRCSSRQVILIPASLNRRKKPCGPWCGPFPSITGSLPSRICWTRPAVGRFPRRRPYRRSLTR